MDGDNRIPLSLFQKINFCIASFKIGHGSPFYKWMEKYKAFRRTMRGMGIAGLI
jgi:hypothetical protein